MLDLELAPHHVLFLLGFVGNTNFQTGCVISFVSADFGMWTYPACKEDQAGPCCGQLDVSHKGLPPVEVNCWLFFLFPRTEARRLLQ